MKIVVVGNGMIGRERIRAIEILGERILAVLDIDDVLTDSLIENADWIFVCTPPVVASEIVHRIGSRTQILVEKPYLGMQEPLYVGYNYRFFKGVNQLLCDVENGVFGELISVNMTLGMGDDPNVKKTWRFDPLQSGGSVAIDLGVHLVDIAMLMSHCDIKLDCTHKWKGFWKMGEYEEVHWIGLDDTTIYNIQVSKVRWRSVFRIEVNGIGGYGIVEGRNKHYGNQTYRRGKRWAWIGGTPQRDTEELVVDYDGDDSFLNETKAVLYGTDSIIKPATHLDNKRCLRFIRGL